ncbi:MAG TPA: hypothetical protein VIL41_02310 [Coriobacteriia bacterium]
MRKHLGKRVAIVFVAAAVAAIVAAGTALAAPVLQPGVNSAPGMSGTCTNCHTYAKPAVAKPAVAKPAAKPVLFSRPFVKKAHFRRGRTFTAAGYFSPTLASATNATVTISVERRNAHGRWVATPSYNETATLSPTGKYKNEINYTAAMKINRLGKFRLRAKLVYLDASSVSQSKWSKPTTVTIKKR